MLHYVVKYIVMATRSQAMRLLWKALRALGALALTGAALVAIAVGLGKVLARPVEPPKPVYVDPEQTARPYLTVAGMGVDIEVVGPDGGRAFTGALPDSAAAPIPGADARVDCSGYGQPSATESVCSASVLIPNPAFGDYRVIVSANSPRGLPVTWGWGGASFRRSGGGDARVIVEPRAPVTFTLIVAPEGVSQRTQPVVVERATPRLRRP